MWLTAGDVAALTSSDVDNYAQVDDGVLWVDTMSDGVIHYQRAFLSVWFDTVALELFVDCWTGENPLVRMEA